MAESEQYRAFRESVVDSVRRELVGPVLEDGEEIQHEFLSVSPLNHYAMGVLFPQKAVQERHEDAAEDDATTDPDDGEAMADTSPEQSRSERRLDLLRTPDGGSEEEPLNLANEFSPSALGLSFRVCECRGLIVDVYASTYVRAEKELPNPRAGARRTDGSIEPETVRRPGFRRRPVHATIPVPINDTGRVAIDVAGTNGTLKVHATVRQERGGTRTVSLMLVNHRVLADAAPAKVASCYFQAALRVRGADGRDVFCPIDRESGVVLPEEQASLELLYRHRRSFALGHGCAGDWHKEEEVEASARTSLVWTTSFPVYEVAPINPREEALHVEHLNLSMQFLGSGDGHTESERTQSIVRSLEALCEDYSLWIDSRERDSHALEGQMRTTAARHIQHCRECLARMHAGSGELAQNPRAMLAFRLANQAMLMQQVHTSLPLREPGGPYPEGAVRYTGEDASSRSWRPFQLAFILMNVAGTRDQDHPDRTLVDLIWFPTGGGKTEAYLGLTAFAICLRRLREPSNAGTTVLMRYTLRLLTAQQFQRASALVLALEMLRRERFLGAAMGDKPISIGLWVGKSLSPNKRTDAVRALRKLREESAWATNPFQVLFCPWCKVAFDNPRRYGYVERKVGRTGPTTVSFRCPSPECDFGRTDTLLPITVIDEDIYDDPPTLLIGTVDKFAQIAWVEDTGVLFGVGLDVDPPELVIQDELHLISGPLGSIVGLYETAIMRLCCQGGHTPKIVASTATIRRAADQCSGLYGRRSFEFPPAGLTAGESYFAYEDRSAPGRLFAGVFPSALKSLVTAEVRACGALLQAVRLAADEHPEGTANSHPRSRDR